MQSTGSPWCFSRRDLAEVVGRDHDLAGRHQGRHVEVGLQHGRQLAQLLIGLVQVLRAAAEQLAGQHDHRLAGGVDDVVEADAALELRVGPQILPGLRRGLDQVGAVAEAERRDHADRGPAVAGLGDRVQILVVGHQREVELLEIPLLAQQRGEDLVHHHHGIGRLVPAGRPQGRGEGAAEADVELGLGAGRGLEGRHQALAPERLPDPAIGGDHQLLRRGRQGREPQHGRTHQGRACHDNLPSSGLHVSISAVRGLAVDRRPGRRLPEDLCRVPWRSQDAFLRYS